MPLSGLKILCEPSTPAIKQAKGVMSCFTEIDYEIKEISGCGDKRRDISLSTEFPVSSVVRELYKALIDGQGDIAILSAKDLTFSMPDELEIICLITATRTLKHLELKNKIREVLPLKTYQLKGNLVVIALSNRADLKVFFSKIDARKDYGKVYLIGAGPGDPELITIKADKILKNVDSIYYDNLLDKTILENYFCKKIYVGKRKGKFTYSQNEINEILYQEALRGKKVARLKGGDPFIFGRGGEELGYLQKRFIEVEVIPGISSAQSAAAVSLIPLTMRGVSKKLSFLTGHTAENNYCKDTFNSSSTMVYFMGATRLKEISSELISEGNAPDTPAALIQNAGLVNEKIIISSLSEMAKIEIESPVITIIGNVVKIFHKQPKILFTGLNPEHCKVRGKIVHYPLIEIDNLNFTVEKLNSYDAVLFTDKTAVNIFFKKHPILKSQKFIALNRYIKNQIENYGYKVDYQPIAADYDNLAELINKLNLKSILYLCLALRYNRIHNIKNVEIKEAVYKTRYKIQPKLNLQEFSGIVFSCNSTVDAFFNLYNSIPQNVVIYVYEKNTVKKLAAKGYTDNVQIIPGL